MEAAPGAGRDGQTRTGEADVRLGSGLSPAPRLCAAATRHVTSRRPDLAVRPARRQVLCVLRVGTGAAPGASRPRLGRRTSHRPLCHTARRCVRGVLRSACPGTPGCAFPDEESGGERSPPMEAQGCRGSSWRGVPAGSPTGDSLGPVPEAPVGTPRGSPRGACPGRRDITLAIVLGSGIFPRPSSLPFRRPQMSPFGESYHFLNAVEACLGCPPHPGPATLSEPAEESLVGYGHRRLQSVLVLCRVTSAFLRKRRRLAHLSNAKRGSCLS